MDQAARVIEPAISKKTELRMLQNAWVKLWHTYITWFTWHFAIHITILTGFLSIPALQKQGRISLFAILGFAILGLGATLAMIAYEFETRARLKALDANVSWVVFGGYLSRYASIATLLTTVLLVGVWTYVICKWPLVPSPQSN